MDPEEYAKKGVDKVYPDYNWLPDSAVQRGSIKSTPIRGDSLLLGTDILHLLKHGLVIKTEITDPVFYR